MSELVLKTLAVACELTNTSLSEGAVKLIADELRRYPEPQVLGALRQCCKEVKGKLTLADILTRLQDGRPGAEEAWSMLYSIMRNEQASIVWTEEMRQAYSVVAPLANEPIAARMAFKERYTELVQQARDRCEPVQWTVSLGYDAQQRQDVVQQAVQAGRLTELEGRRLCPALPAAGTEVDRLIASLQITTRGF